MFGLLRSRCRHGTGARDGASDILCVTSPKRAPAMSEMDIRTRRLRLRDFQASDWEGLLRVESDKEAVRYQSYEARTREECQHYIARDIAARLPERWCFD